MVVDELLSHQLHNVEHVLGEQEGYLGEDHGTLVTSNGLLLGPLLAMEVAVTLGGQELGGGEGRGGEGRGRGEERGGGRGGLQCTTDAHWSSPLHLAPSNKHTALLSTHHSSEQRTPLHDGSHHSVTGIGSCRSVWITRGGGAVCVGPALGPLPNDQLIGMPSCRPLEGVVIAVDHFIDLEHCVGGYGDVSG